LFFHFRKKALEKLEGQEELDQVLKVTSPLSWLLLIAIVIVVVGVLIWSIYGSIPSRVSGKGIILTRDNALIDAIAYEYGKVVNIHVQIGEKVTKDQLLAEILRDDINQKIDELEKKLAFLSDEEQKAEDRIKEEIATQKDYVQKQIAAEQQIIDSRQKDLDYINSTLQKKQQMMVKGYLSKDEFERTLQAQRQNTREITSAQSEILRLQNSINEVQNIRNEKLDDMKKDLEEAKLELQNAKSNQALTVNIKSPSNGEVISIPVNIGDHVNKGQPLLSILQPGGSLTVAGFVPAENEGGKIAPGMPALIEPAGVKREMYGSMIGTVSFVSPFPVSAERLIAILHNEDLARKILATTSLLEIRVSLKQTKDPKSGKLQYAWTSKRGQKLIINPGTICKINVTVEKNPPITLIVPALKKLIGVY
jgi:HlyD family secretion protein